MDFNGLGGYSELNADSGRNFRNSEGASSDNVGI